ncbi:unnamed protein product [Prunus armeniaca]
MGASSVKSTAPYKGYRPTPSTQLLSLGRSEDGPWISSAKSTRPRPTSTPGFWSQLTISLNVRSLRVTERPRQEEKDYAQAMAQESEDLEQSRLDAYNLMQPQKQVAARSYNKKVKQRTFAEGYLVWRAVLPIETKDPRFGKFSPN